MPPPQTLLIALLLHAALAAISSLHRAMAHRRVTVTTLKPSFRVTGAMIGSKGGSSTGAGWAQAPANTATRTMEPLLQICTYSSLEGEARNEKL